MSAPTTPLEWLTVLSRDAAATFVVTVGFALLFAVPRRYLLGSALAGVLGHVARTAAVERGVPLELATLIGATTIGAVSALLARRVRVPMSLFSMSAMIALVPGTFAYRTMLALIALVSTPSPPASLATDALVLGTRTALVVGAIAVGVVSPSLFLDRSR
ncbi:MAG TPA: threonine/serine exporter family protein [Polyangiaceae bacterium]|nr:threonine/serine exporter family protein [Polyangiaceae bacterium]